MILGTIAEVDDLLGEYRQGYFVRRGITACQGMDRTGDFALQDPPRQVDDFEQSTSKCHGALAMAFHLSVGYR